MRRKEFMRYLVHNHCVLFREGAKHSIVKNAINGKTSTVPRHTEVDDYLAKKICRDLNIPVVLK